jgi:hypothetical protein
VKWSGTTFSSGASVLAYDSYTLTSECKCGYQYSVRVVAKGLGLGRGFGFSGQFVEFDDYLPCPDPDLLAGDYFSVSATVAGVFGAGFGVSQLGSAGNPGAVSAAYGLAANAGVTIGKSSLVYKVRSNCQPCRNR